MNKSCGIEVFTTYQCRKHLTYLNLNSQNALGWKNLKTHLICAMGKDTFHYPS